MQQQESTPLLSITEFAARLRVTRACVRRWLFEHKVAFVKLGRLVRIPANEANRLISEGLHPARSVDTIPAALKPLAELARKRRDQKREEASATQRGAK